MRVIRFAKDNPAKKLVSGTHLFGLMFKSKQEVVVIDDMDQLWWGRLISWDEEGINLAKPKGRISTHLSWDSIQFIAHDGFPVRPLFGADGRASIEQEDTKEVQKAVRKSLSVTGLPDGVKTIHEFKEQQMLENLVRKTTSLTGLQCPDCKTFVENSRMQEMCDIKSAGETVEVCVTCAEQKKRYYVIRHPYLIESVPVNILVNPGLEQPIKTCCDEFEETLVMRSKDGAGALMWDIPSIYYFE